MGDSMKKCTACGKELPTTSFSGFNTKCKPCKSLLTADWRRRNPGKANAATIAWAQANPDKAKACHNSSKARWYIRNKDLAMEKRIARTTLNHRVQDGTVSKPTVCTECNMDSTVIEGHHEDYSKPLEVEWLCTTCHHKRHRRIKEHGPIAVST